MAVIYSELNHLVKFHIYLSDLKCIQWKTEFTTKLDRKSILVALLITIEIERLSFHNKSESFGKL